MSFLKDFCAAEGMDDKKTSTGNMGQQTQAGRADGERFWRNGTRVNIVDRDAETASGGAASTSENDEQAEQQEKAKQDTPPPADDTGASGVDADAAEKEFKKAAPRIPRFQRGAVVPLDPADYVPLEDEIICGIARRGDLLLVGAPSKGNKTWCALDLAVSVQCGAPWMGFETKQTDVLLVNTELSQALCQRRVDAILRAHNLPNSAVQGMDAIHLRGVDYTTFLPRTREEILGFNDKVPCFEEELSNMDMRRFGMIIFDPIYVILSGDENSNSEMRAIVLLLSRIATQNKSLLMITHHFAKGKASDKDQIDRFCGAGVFARAPDALLTLTPMKTEIEDVEANGKLVLLETSLRGFKEPMPAAYRFQWPRFVKDDNIVATTADSTKIIDEPTFKKAVNKLPMPVTIKKLADYLGVGATTVRRYLAEYGITLAAEVKETPDQALRRLYDDLPKPLDVKRLAAAAMVPVKTAKAWVAANVQVAETDEADDEIEETADETDEMDEMTADGVGHE